MVNDGFVVRNDIVTFEQLESAVKSAAASKAAAEIFAAPT